jgi:hypothetical protein
MERKIFKTLHKNICAAGAGAVRGPRLCPCAGSMARARAVCRVGGAGRAGPLSASARILQWAASDWSVCDSASGGSETESNQVPAVAGRYGQVTGG